MTTTATASTTDQTTTPGTIAKGAGIGAGLAVIANLVVFAIGNAGAPLRVITNGAKPSDLAVGLVIAASIAPVIVAACGLWVFERFLTNGFRVWAITTMVLALVSIAAPMGLDIDTKSKFALALMHLAVGASTVVGQAVARRGGAPAR